MDVKVLGAAMTPFGRHTDADLRSLAVAATTADLIAFAGERLAGYKKPKTVDFVAELPKTTYGKLDKKAVRAPYWAGQERMVR